MPAPAESFIGTFVTDGNHGAVVTSCVDANLAQQTLRAYQEDRPSPRRLDISASSRRPANPHTDSPVPDTLTYGEPARAYGKHVRAYGKPVRGKRVRASHAS